MKTRYFPPEALAKLRLPLLRIYVFTYVWTRIYYIQAQIDVKEQLSLARDRIEKLEGLLRSNGIAEGSEVSEAGPLVHRMMQIRRYASLVSSSTFQDSSHSLPNKCFSPLNSQKKCARDIRGLDKKPDPRDVHEYYAWRCRMCSACYGHVKRDSPEMIDQIIGTGWRMPVPGLQE